MDSEELEIEPNKYLSLGFNYHFDKNIYKDVHVITPERNMSSISNIEKILSRKLIFGDEKQIEAIEAAEFFKVVEDYY